MTSVNRRAFVAAAAVRPQYQEEITVRRARGLTEFRGEAATSVKLEVAPPEFRGRCH
jgi:hypothetical protein